MAHRAGEEVSGHVPCSHVGLCECGCSSVERKIRGFAEFPELLEEHEARLDALWRRHGEEFL